MRNGELDLERLPVSTVIIQKPTGKPPYFTQEQLLYLQRMFPEKLKGTTDELLQASGSRQVVQHIAQLIEKQGL